MFWNGTNEPCSWLEPLFTNVKDRRRGALLRTLRHFALGTTRKRVTVSGCGYITPGIGSYYFVIRFQPCRPHAVVPSLRYKNQNIPLRCPTARNAKNQFILVSRAIYILHLSIFSFSFFLHFFIRYFFSVERIIVCVLHLRVGFTLAATVERAVVFS